MKTLCFVLLLSTFAACTTKDEAFLKAQGSNLSEQNGGPQTTTTGVSEKAEASPTPAQ